jgi:hypothetical protein
MMTTLKHFNIYKKRDGQSFELKGNIYTDTFENAKKEFAENMTKDNWEKSNDIVWLSKENDGVESGWYDMSSSAIVYNQDGTINENESELQLFCLENDIKEGFDTWSEDVYTWEIRDCKTFEIYDFAGDLVDQENFSSIEEAKEFYPESEDFTVKEI